MYILRGSSVKIGTIQRRLAWPLRKDDIHIFIRAPGGGGPGDYGQFSKFHVCFCGLDPGNLKCETVRTNKQHICF